jgi:ABC-type multidrug transport system ATPase subunit
MRQKILLSAALLHDPDILILDEPFSGLDVTSALMLRRLLHALADRGKITLYSSHVLEVVEKICSTVVILRKGEVVAYDSIERLRELMSQPSLEGVFAQLAEVDDGEDVANRIVEVMAHRGRSCRSERSAGAAGGYRPAGLSCHRQRVPGRVSKRLRRRIVENRGRRDRARLAATWRLRPGAPADRRGGAGRDRAGG